MLLSTNTELLPPTASSLQSNTMYHNTTRQDKNKERNINTPVGSILSTAIASLFKGCSQHGMLCHKTKGSHVFNVIWSAPSPSFRLPGDLFGSSNEITANEPLKRDTGKPLNLGSPCISIFLAISLSSP